VYRFRWRAEAVSGFAPALPRVRKPSDFAEVSGFAKATPDETPGILLFISVLPENQTRSSMLPADSPLC
jgi:hypothetical protein